jgi:hypothetical protein
MLKLFPLQLAVVRGKLFAARFVSLHQMFRNGSMKGATLQLVHTSI